MAEDGGQLSYYRKKNSNKRQATEELEKMLRDSQKKRRVDVIAPSCSAVQVNGLALWFCLDCLVFSLIRVFIFIR
jgi:hypothetical protein